MSVTIEQSAAASFPDRPSIDGMGLRIALTPGSAGRYLSVPHLGTSTPIHVRLMVRADLLTGGPVVFCRCADAQAQPVVDMRLEADGRLSIVANGSIVAGHALAQALRWVAVEVAVDADQGQLSCWLDGRLIFGAAVSVSPVAEVWLGAIARHTGSSGEIHLDEIVLADQYVGPVVVEPDSPFADDPRRWLVIYNRIDPDSVTWAQAYRDARNVPYANLLGLALPTDETISQPDFATLRDAISAYLTLNGLDADIVGIICGHRVPGYYTRSDDQLGTIAAQLQWIDGLDSPIANPLATPAIGDRPTPGTLAGPRMTARVDAPTLADALAMHERSIALTQADPGDGSNMKLWFDPTTTGGAYAASEMLMRDWFDSIDRQRLLVPTETTQATDPPTDVQFSSIHDDGFYLGWHADAPPSAFFGEPAGARVFAMQMTDLAATAPTLRDAQHDSWAIAALQAGYAATAGSSDIGPIEAAPMAAPFFEALRRGWTMGEAWFVASVLLRTHTTLIGDPLASVPFPHAGWELFGPLERPDDIDFDLPIAVLRESQRAFDVSATHQTPGTPSMYALSHLDDVGRRDAIAWIDRVDMIDGQSAQRPPLPLWPALPGWRPKIDGAIASVTAIWARPLREEAITRVWLEAKPAGGQATVVAEHSLNATATHAELSFALTTMQTQLRIVVESDPGNTIASPWSRPVGTNPAQSSDVTPLPL